MLVCPQCSYENTNTNKFCIGCGNSLTHKVCDRCGEAVAFNREHCQQCGHLTGTIRAALIRNPQALTLVESPLPDSPAPVPNPSVVGNAPNLNAPNLEAIDQDVTMPLGFSQQPVTTLASPNPQAEVLTELFLDQAKRYRLREAFPPTLPPEIIGQVLDCQPFQQSPLLAFTDPQLLSSPSPEEPADGPSQPAAALAAMTLPPVAKAYLSLREQFYLTIPALHDAWIAGEADILILEDRILWPRLKDLWANEPLSLMQALYWLNELAQLWEAFGEWHCRQSLLEVDNFRVDEDQILCLARLYPDTSEVELTLQDAAVVWQQLFQQPHRTQFGALHSLLIDLRDGQIADIPALQARLQQMHLEAERSLLTPEPMVPDPTEATVAIAPPEDSLRNSDGDDMPTVILPMQLLSLDDAGCTDIGRQREHNEDNFGIHTWISKQETPLGRTVQAKGLYILCDGMGGHAGGEVASSLAVDTLRKFFQTHWTDRLPDEALIKEGILAANQAIYEVNQKNARSGSGRMGTTLVMVLVQETDVAIAHVGDSRLYRLSRKRGIEQVTTDHEVGQREIQRGVEPAIAYSRPDAYQLTQALGPRDSQFVRPDVQFLELNEDTLLLLCSDGLSDNDLPETYWQTHLLPLLSSRANLDQGLLQLIDLANQHNGHDNITAVLIRAKVRPDLNQQQPLG